jgi:hypothetical protein
MKKNITLSLKDLSLIPMDLPPLKKKIPVWQLQNNYPPGTPTPLKKPCLI